METPTRCFHTSTLLTDVMVIDKFYKKYLIIYVDPGYPDKSAQFLCLKLPKATTNSIFLRKRSCTENNNQGFIYLLKDKSWEEVVALEDFNTSFNAFKKKCYYFNIEFSDKTLCIKNKKQSKRIAQGLNVSRNKLWFLNRINYVIPLSKFEIYFKKYQLKFQNIIKVIKSGNDRFIMSTDNKTKSYGS